MIALKVIALALGVGALFAMYSADLGADFVLAMVSCALGHPAGRRAACARTNSAPFVTTCSERENKSHFRRWVTYVRRLAGRPDF